jgi:hypothetical protein
VGGIRTCWVNNFPSNKDINGLKLILSNGDSKSDIFLNTWGELEGLCQTYTVAEGQFIKTVQLSFSSSGISGFSFITNKGEYRTYGHTEITHTVAKFSFSEQVPWLGLYGTVKSKSTSLGVVSIRSNCDFTYLGQPKPTVQLSSGSMNNQLESNSTNSWIVILVIVLVFIIAV